MRRSALPLIALALFVVGCDADGDGVKNGDDCAPDNADISPDAEEVCDGVDNNCDGSVDEGVTLTFFGDADADGYAGETLSIEACEAPAGFFETADDCNDLDASAFPGGTEVCDDIDNDCDGLVDDEDDDVDLSTAGTYFADADGDGYGDAGSSVQSCGTPSGYVDNDLDCNDADADIHPETLWYADIDGDGYGAANFTETSCEQPSGYVADSTDCDDLDALINPAAAEICDGGVDNDCDGLADDADDSVDATGFSTFYSDGDADGYGLDDTTWDGCNVPSGYADVGGDCDDSAADVNPDAEEVCEDGIDNDCSGDAPECGIAPGAYTSAEATYEINGENSSDYLGISVATADLDGDGTDELITGAYQNDDISTYSGKTYVFYGLTSSSSGATADVAFTGAGYYHRNGFSVANAGDVNGDGYEDMLTSSYYGGGSYYGQAYLLYGSASALSSGGIVASADSTFTGDSGTYDYFGQGVFGLGDLDGDGYDDIGVGEYSNDDISTSAGALFVWYGSASTLSSASASSADLSIWGDYYYYVGYRNSVSGVGDMDGDGNDELSVGARYGSNSYYGGTYLWYGPVSLTGAIDIDDSDAYIVGTGTYDYFGEGQASADFDGDGYGDLAVGEYYGSSNLGAVYIFTGHTSVLSGAYDAADDAAYTFDGELTYDYFGRAIAAGDFNNDGNPDLAVGASGHDDSDYGMGAVYVWYGPITGGAGGADADVIVTGDESYESIGYDVKAGDVTGDGVDDLIFGGYGSDSYTGAVFVFEGGSQ